MPTAKQAAPLTTAPYGPRPVILASDDGRGEGLEGWAEAYFRHQVTTSESSQAVQRRDLGRFLAFLLLEEGFV